MRGYTQRLPHYEAKKDGRKAEPGSLKKHKVALMRDSFVCRRSDSAGKRFNFVPVQMIPKNTRIEALYELAIFINEKVSRHLYLFCYRTVIRDVAERAKAHEGYKFPCPASEAHIVTDRNAKW